MATRRHFVATIAALFLAACASVPPTEIRVMTSGGFTAAYRELTPEFERQTGHRVATAYGASQGGAPDSIPSRLARGEPVDVVILAAPALEALVKDGRVVPGSRVDLVHSNMGMVVRSGAPKPDISTLEAFRRTLLEAKSIAYSASVSGTYLSTELFQQLGIADRVLPKSRRIEGERVGAVVARGDAEVGVQQVSELLPVSGIEIVRMLPPEFQLTIVYATTAFPQAAQRDAARAFVEFLHSAQARDVLRRKGLEPA